MEITAKKTLKVEGQEDKQVEATIEKDFGVDCETAIEMFGADVVYSGFCANAKITGQAAIRRMLENGSDQATVTERMAEWVPGTKLERIVDPVGNIRKKVAAGELSAEDRAELIAMLSA